MPELDEKLNFLGVSSNVRSSRVAWAPSLPPSHATSTTRVTEDFQDGESAQAVAP